MKFLSLIPFVFFFSILLGQVPTDTLAESDTNSYIFDATEPIPLNMDEVRQMIGYPKNLVDADVQGMVVIRVLVDENGNPVKYKPIKGDSRLSNAVESHIMKLRFIPATQGDENIKFWVNIPFTFKLLGPTRKKRKKKRNRSN